MIDISLLKSIRSPSGLPIYYKGPPLEEGKLPAFFYFALSAEESLGLDPFNQPVVSLSNLPIRIFSFTIPEHGKGLKNTEAMKRWSDAIKKGQDPLTPFFQQCRENIEFLIRHDIIDDQMLAAGGLSRGGFIALHLASQIPQLGAVLGFSPLTTTHTIEEFHQLKKNPILQSYEINCSSLIGKKVRFYIGNRDTRVSTDACYQFIRGLTEANYNQKIRSPEVELVISPSIGHKGHGTPPGIFEAGAKWIASLLT